MLDIFLTLHLIIFLLSLLFFWVLEYFFPYRKKIDLKIRFIHNLSLSVVNTIIVRFLFFISPVSVWIYVWNNGIGLLNLLEINFFVGLFISILFLDFFIYLQHIAFHKINFFWKLHSIHHTDEILDITTSVRFHSLEIILSLFFKIILVFIFWFSPLSIVFFEILLSSSSVFNHSNLNINKKFDKYLSFFMVTPLFHQVHHSIIQKQTDSNYWFFFSIWDKIFWTYTKHQFRVEEIWLKWKKLRKFKEFFYIS